MCRPLRGCFAPALGCRPQSHFARRVELGREGFYLSLRGEELVVHTVHRVSCTKNFTDYSMMWRQLV